jgi:hypothetical protein
MDTGAPDASTSRSTTLKTSSNDNNNSSYVPTPTADSFQDTENEAEIFHGEATTILHSSDSDSEDGDDNNNYINVSVMEEADEGITEQSPINRTTAYDGQFAIEDVNEGDDDEDCTKRSDSDEFSIENENTVVGQTEENTERNKEGIGNSYSSAENLLLNSNNNFISLLLTFVVFRFYCSYLQQY